jgi:hypothetical protein
MVSRKTASVAVVLFLAAAVSACTQSALRLSPDFGHAVRQDVAAQIADPDARYKGVPAPGSGAARVGLAQRRYDTNEVIQPSTTGASSSRSMQGGENGSNGGAGASAGVGVGP